MPYGRSDRATASPRAIQDTGAPGYSASFLNTSGTVAGALSRRTVALIRLESPSVRATEPASTLAVLERRTC